MKTWFPLLGLCGAVILFGAGCSSEPVLDANDVTVPTSTDTVKSYSTSTTDTVATSTNAVTTSTQPTPSSSSSTSMDQNEPLAFPGILPANEANKKIKIKTTAGDIVIQLDAAQGPRAASNFVYLVKRGFFDGTIFHRVIPGFMIQGGDPTGTGRGGPGYRFENDEVKSAYNDGVVAMANAGRDTNGSQFFIMVANVPLPPDYSIFGKVVSGLDIAHKIAVVSRDGDDRPYEEVKMISVTVEK
ncbi:MAG: peptidylprolyl isomerase [bacterium]|nr:peptidylprolyl isomerase [bacterium]